jgi:hypothetical protein
MDVKGWSEGDLHYMESDASITVKNGGLELISVKLLGTFVALSPGESFTKQKPPSWWDKPKNNPPLQTAEAQKYFGINDVNSNQYAMSHFSIHGKEGQIIDAEYDPMKLTCKCGRPIVDGNWESCSCKSPSLPPVEPKKKRKMSLGRYR